MSIKWENFEYELEEDKVKIKKGINQEKIIIVPSKIEEKEVTKIADYAFSEWRNLEEIYLPETLITIGKHAFYNCRRLRKITFLGTIIDLGDGAFKNCNSIKEIFLETENKEMIGLKKILSEIYWEILINICYKTEEKTAKLLFPSYDYEFVPNVPARIFSEEIYGSGNSYRLCVTQDGIDYKKYDSLFYLAKRENNKHTIFEIITARLMYPYSLLEIDKNNYINYIKENLTIFMQILIEEEAIEKIHFIAEIGIITKENIDQLLKIAIDSGFVSIIGFLLEYQNNYLEKKEKSFEL